MEKRPLGEFLAALRREKGLTQKELADILHVSDKTVSRWERDEGVPDLFLIPDIARLYGLTSDEVIRGQRAEQEEEKQNFGGCGIEKSVEPDEECQQKALWEKLRQYRAISLVVAFIGVAPMFLFLNHLSEMTYYCSLILQLVAGLGFLASTILMWKQISGEGYETLSWRRFRRELIYLAEKVLAGEIFLLDYSIFLANFNGADFVECLLSNLFGLGVLCLVTALVSNRLLSDQGDIAKWGE